MKTTIVYRVEKRATGTGPYRRTSINALRTMQDSHQRDSDRRPAPHPSGFKDGDLFGFGSQRALRRWFLKAERLLLEECQFVVRKYEVPEEYVFREHPRQVSFDMSEATHIASFPLSLF